MSVARVAREAGVNTKQVFAWIKQHRDGALRATSEAGPTLLAVRVAKPEAVVDAQSPRGPNTRVWLDLRAYAQRLCRRSCASFRPSLNAISMALYISL